MSYLMILSYTLLILQNYINYFLLFLLISLYEESKLRAEVSV